MGFFSDLQSDASVGFGYRRHAVLPFAVTGEGDQVVVAITVGDQRVSAIRLEEVQRYGLCLDLRAVLRADDDGPHLQNAQQVCASATRDD